MLVSKLQVLLLTYISISKNNTYVVVPFLLAFVNEISLEFLDLSRLRLVIFRMGLLILDNTVAVLFYGLYIKVYLTSLEFWLCCAH